MDLDTSDVVNMEKMFKNCKIIKSIDLSKISVKQVMKFNYFFQNCFSLELVNMACFEQMNTSAETKGMFKGCRSLSIIEGVGEDIPIFRAL